jgi:hypothetical protein
MLLTFALGGKKEGILMFFQRNKMFEAMSVGNITFLLGILVSVFLSLF